MTEHLAETPIDDLSAFLRARWDEEEQMAYTMQPGIANACAPRTISDIMAKRRILDEAIPLVDTLNDIAFSEGLGACPGEAAACLLKLLALPYASHLAYRQEWTP